MKRFKENYILDLIKEDKKTSNNRKTLFFGHYYSITTLTTKFQIHKNHFHCIFLDSLLIFFKFFSASRITNKNSFFTMPVIKKIDPVFLLFSFYFQFFIHRLFFIL